MKYIWNFDLGNFQAASFVNFSSREGFLKNGGEESKLILPMNGDFEGFPLILIVHCLGW